MHLLLLRKILAMSKFFLYIAWLQGIFATVALANSSHAQELTRVAVSCNWEKITLEKAFADIQVQTDYFFSYDLRQIRQVRISGHNEVVSLLDLLKYISSETGLRFSIRDELIRVEYETFLQNSLQKEIPRSTIQLPDVSQLEEILTGLNYQIIYQLAESDMPFDRIVRGIVTSMQGEPLIGATVVIKGTGQGTITDVDGAFSLGVPEAEDILVISYLGYESQEVKLQGRSEIAVNLQLSATALNEVVVVGYGTQDRSDVDGAVASVDPGTLNSYPASTIEQSLIGNVPGVHFVQSSGAPGAGISVRVRGVTSIAGGNEPLYVIDGVPFFNSDVRGLNGLSTINPNDIESIEILKDAAATAIYGSRGGNGVVLITTKSGKSQTSSINYNAWFSSEKPINYVDMMDAAGFATYAQRWAENSGQTVPEEVLQGADTDWQEEIMHTAFSQNHNLNFSGGSDQSRYYFALGYLDQEGVVTNSNFERFTMRANMSNFVSDAVSIQTSILGNHSIQNGVVPAENNNTFSISKTAIGAALWSYPTIPIRNGEGEYSAINGFVENPVLYVNEVLDQSTVNRWLGSSTVKVNILNGLSNNTRLGVDFTDHRKDLYFPRTMRIVLGGDGAAIQQNRASFNYVVENFLEYKGKLGNELMLEGIAGASLQRETTRFSRIEGAGFISDDLQNNAIQAAQNVGIPITTVTEMSIASLFGRIRFKYKDRYIFASSIRRDGASVFSENNKIATFPSLSFAWKIQEENFLKEKDWITDLKARLSWGRSGNPAIQPYQSLPLGLLLSTSQGAGSDLVVGLAPNLPNRNLSWETTTQVNIGLDFGFFNNRITGALDYYRKQTEGALSTVQLAPSAGFNTIIDNVGEVENKGVELSLNTVLIEREQLDLTVGFTISTNNNKVTKTKNNQDISETLSSSNGGGEIFNTIRVGEVLGSFLGYQFTGFDENGTPQHLDLNNDGQLDANDFVILGSPFPNLLFGINTALNYKNFSLAASFQGVSGNEVYNVMQYILTDPNDADFNRMTNVYDFYPNPNANLAHLPSDRYLEDASYFRMRSLRLGYNLPLSNSFIEGINFYVSGQNLFTITDYTGYDPEVNSLNGNNLTQGIDLSAYPSTKSYTFGLNVKF